MIDRENNDSGNIEKKSLLTPNELAQERENAALDEQLRASRKKAAEDIEWQAKQTGQIQNVAGSYSLFYRTWAVTTSAIQLAGTAIGAAASYIPFINAIFNGLFFVVDMVEAIFISQETRNRRFVKALNSTIGTGLTIASVVLSLNPATAPLGLALSATAIGIATAKEAFFWYKASKDLRTAKEKLATAKQKVADDISEFVEHNHKDDIKQVREINYKINHIREHQVSILPTVQAELNTLRQQRHDVVVKINKSVHDQEDILAARTQINELKEKVNECRIYRNEKKKGFFTNLASFVGVALLAVAAVTVAAALLSNPFGLAIAGVAILGVATVVAIRNKFFPHKPKMEEVVADLPAATSESQAEDNALHHDLHLDHPHSYAVSQRHRYMGDTEKIVHQLAGGSHRREHEIWENQQAQASPIHPAEQASFIHSQQPAESQSQSTVDVMKQSEAQVPVSAAAKKSK
jgi:hypothetical protein